MSKFCTQCGSPLPESGVCSCQSATPAAPPVESAQPPAQPVQAPVQAPVQTTVQAPVQVPPQAAAPPYPEQPVQPGQPVQTVYVQQVRTPGAFSLYFKRMGAHITGLLKTPVTAGTKFVNEADLPVAFGFIGAQSLSIALLMLTGAAKLNGELPLDFPLFTIFLFGLIIPFALACLMPAILMLFITLFKGKTSYKHMLCVSGVNSVYTIPFILLAILVCLIIPFKLTDLSLSGVLLAGCILVPLIIWLAGIMLGQFVALKSMRGGCSVSEDNRVYVMFFTVLVMMVVTYLAIKIVKPACMPKVKNTMDFLENIDWGSLLF